MPYDDATEEDTVGEAGEQSAAAPVAAPKELEGGESRAAGRERGGKEPFPAWKFQTYKEAASKYYLHLSDNNMVGGARGANTVQTVGGFYIDRHRLDNQ